MRKSLTAVFVLILAFAVTPGSSMAGQMEDRYYQDVADYYHVSYDVIVDLIDKDISDEDIPVVLHIADRAKVDYSEIAQMMTVPMASPPRIGPIQIRKAS